MIAVNGTLRDESADADLNQVGAPSLLLWVASSVAVLVLILYMVVISIPTSSRTRLVTVPFEPLHPPFAEVPVAVNSASPVKLRLRTDDEQLRKVELFTSLGPNAVTDDLRLSVRDVSSGRRLATAVVPASLVVDVGFTTAKFRSYRADGAVDLEIVAVHTPTKPEDAVRLQGGPGDIVPGLHLRNASLMPAVGGITANVYGVQRGTGARLSLMMRRSAARWPGHTGAGVLVAALVLMGASSLVAGFVLAQLLRPLTRRTRVGAVVVVVAMCTETVYHVMHTR